jgi:nucleotide-binding universal stress UspA family protein
MHHGCAAPKLEVSQKLEYLMYERILICTDGSALSQKAVHAGIVLAAALQAEIVAYTVIPPHPHWSFEAGVVMTNTEMAQFENERSQAAQAIVDAIQEEAHKRNVKTVALTSRGAVAQNIIYTAEKYKCDLIVMASHGRKGIQRILLGSETMDVLTHSHIPVLVLR